MGLSRDGKPITPWVGSWAQTEAQRKQAGHQPASGGSKVMAPLPGPKPKL